MFMEIVVCILKAEIVWGLQKLGLILEHEVPQNLKLAKHDSV